MQGQKRLAEYTSGNDPSTPKIRKVTRACDSCKSKKAKCTGDQPCEKCIARDIECLYNASYTRGTKITPPPSNAARRVTISIENDDDLEYEDQDQTQASMARNGTDLDTHNGMMHVTSSHGANGDSTGPSRASPELGMAEIQGQVFDPTSSLAFLHRAWKRLSVRKDKNEATEYRPSSESHLITMSGDKSLSVSRDITQDILPDVEDAKVLMTLYFDVCIATYRCLHRPSVDRWLSTMQDNVKEGVPVWTGIGRAKAAVVYVALAMAKRHQEKSKITVAREEDAQALRGTDELFAFSTTLTDQDTGVPVVESAQAHMVQTLYLLTTSRFNQAWYTFGHALRIIAALGWQRRANSARRRAAKPDYIHKQCCLRTFWSAYIIDNYLGVVFGRPRVFHDDDIDQDWPDRVNDEEMTPSGPTCELTENRSGCHTDALIFHAKIARIIGRISREVYSYKHTTEHDRIIAANEMTKHVEEWYRSLPIHLGSIDPAILIPSYRRQAIVLKLAHAHAIMHANRLFLLRNPVSNYSLQIQDCIKAAKSVLETVDYMAKDGPIFHAFWWTHYVTFCALVVTYVWVIKYHRMSQDGAQSDRPSLMRLAERCHTHLAQATASNSPSRRYAVILEEFRSLAVNQARMQKTGDRSRHPVRHITPETPSNGGGEDHSSLPIAIIDHPVPGSNDQLGPDPALAMDVPLILDDWQLTDWLDLDSSAFWPNFTVEDSTLSPPTSL